MKRFATLIALLAMMTLLVSGLTGCGDSAEKENEVSGNWYVVEGSDITTLKLDAEGGGSYAGDSVSYELDGTKLTLTIDGETTDLTIEEDDEYGTVLTAEGVIAAYRSKDAAKEAAAAGSGFDADTGDLVGTWYTVNEDKVGELVFNEDGIGTLNGETFSYEFDGYMIELEPDLLDDFLWLEEDDENGFTVQKTDCTIVAYKDQAKAEAAIGAAAPAPATPAASGSNEGGDAYVGNWVGDSFTYSGIDMSLTEADMTFSVKINADGTATATTNGESDGAANWTYNSDGTITLKDVTGTLPNNSFLDSSGNLHFVLDSDGEPLEIICHKE